MPRRRPLSDFEPAVGPKGQAAITLEDMFAQVVDTTIVGNTATGFTPIVHSHQTTNVAWVFCPTGGFSWPVHVWEVTTPTASAIFLAATRNTPAAATGYDQPGRVIIFQRR
jgi:hypothetical protein